MSVYIFIYVYVPIPCNFFLGPLLALRSTDQFKAFPWSTPLPPPPPPPFPHIEGGREAREEGFFLQMFICLVVMVVKKKYSCYYPHRLRDSLSPVCVIFLVLISQGPNIFMSQNLNNASTFLEHLYFLNI